MKKQAALITALLLLSSSIELLFYADQAAAVDQPGISTFDLTNANSSYAAVLIGNQSHTILAHPAGTSRPEIGLKRAAEGFTAPMTVASPDDGTGRLFIVDMPGTISILDSNGTLQKRPFLDVSHKTVKIITSYDERRLLGLAFHPDFKNDSRVFIYYSVPLRPGAPIGWNHTNRLSEYNISRDDPNMADAGSEKILMEIDMPYLNHNGGQITFGTDGYLYIPTGDGGGSDDVGIGHAPEGNAQNLSNLFGKILRIDIGHSSVDRQYDIPPDNPFIGMGNAQPEIFSYGFRNPSISFDAGGNRSLIAGDPGQMRWEEADMIIKGGNYGWNIKEGSHCFNVQDRSIPITDCRGTGYLGEPLMDPFIEYSYDLGQPITNGFAYRGRALPVLHGHYVFGYRSKSYNKPEGGLMAAFPQPTGKEWTVEDLNIDIGAYALSIGEGLDRDLYLLTSQMPGPAGNTGRIYRIVPGNPSA